VGGHLLYFVGGHLEYFVGGHLVYFVGGHLVYFVAFWYILWSFGIFYGHLKNFSRFGMLYQEKSGSPGWRANVFFYVCMYSKHRKVVQ
jgi:hypothetical protein